MKKRKLISYILIAFLLVTVCGTVMAYMFKKTEYMENRFTPAQVTCEVEETFNSDTSQKTSIKVQNTGNIDVYIRVRFVTYWINEASEIVAEPSVMPDISYDNENWIKGSNDTYYYKIPVNPKSLTDELLTDPIILEKTSDGYLQVVEVFAEAIQSEPDESVTGSWEVTLNGDVITAVP